MSRKPVNPQDDELVAAAYDECPRCGWCDAFFADAKMFSTPSSILLDNYCMRCDARIPLKVMYVRRLEPLNTMYVRWMEEHERLDWP